MGAIHHLRALPAIGWACLLPGLCHLASAAEPPSASALVEQSRALYATLGSYSDTGVITTTYRSGAGPVVAERHTFETVYQSPRRFQMEFRKDRSAGDERFVIWAEGQDFNTWWSSTKVHETYPQGRGAAAFALASLPTKGAAVMIPPLLFAKAGLHGILADLSPVGPITPEEIGGRNCYKVHAVEALAYGSGNVAGARPVTIWIDMDTLLVRQVFEDTPGGTGEGTVSQVTTTLDPVANPSLNTKQFHFDIPMTGN